MESSIIELKSRVRGVKSRAEVLRLQEDISKFIESPQFKQLSEYDKEHVIDLMAEVNSKQDQYTGCNPLNCVSRH